MSLQPDQQRQLAVIKRPRYGMRDGKGPFLSFETYVSACEAATQCLMTKASDALFASTGASDVSELEGKTVWVDVSCSGLIIYIEGSGI